MKLWYEFKLLLKDYWKSNDSERCSSENQFKRKVSTNEKFLTTNNLGAVTFSQVVSCK